MLCWFPRARNIRVCQRCRYVSGAPSCRQRGQRAGHGQAPHGSRILMPGDLSPISERIEVAGRQDGGWSVGP